MGDLQMRCRKQVLMVVVVYLSCVVRAWQVKHRRGLWYCVTKIAVIESELGGCSIELEATHGRGQTGGQADGADGAESRVPRCPR